MMNRDNAVVDELTNLLDPSILAEPSIGESDQENLILTPPKEIAETKKKETSEELAKFLGELAQETGAEQKIRMSITFMRGALAHPLAPRFRDFWETKKVCLSLFKENLPSKLRFDLWKEYIALSEEARRLKEILDEQSAFATEQIELAIQSIERDIEHYDVLLTHVQEIKCVAHCACLKEKEDTYHQLHKELHLLNALAMRINALRKEIIKTEMRIRIKNKLFDRLSLCGDRIFPRRKELIKIVSQEFIHDVERFVADHFDGQEQKIPLYALREEIKSLQSAAKILNLNTHSFTSTRLTLSACWDKLREMEQERRKEVASKRQIFKQNFDVARDKIAVFAEQCKGLIPLDEADRLADEIVTWMRGIQLGKEEIKILREQIVCAKEPVLQRTREQQNHRQQVEKEAENKRLDRIKTVTQQLDHLFAHLEQIELGELVEKREVLLREFQAIPMDKSERQAIERRFKQLKDGIHERKRCMIMSLSEEDLKSIEQLKCILDEHKERRTEIKNQLEGYRKTLGGSDLDFEKAMMYRELLEAERTSLDKINSSIEEIEDKIAEMEG